MRLHVAVMVAAALAGACTASAASAPDWVDSTDGLLQYYFSSAAASAADGEIFCRSMSAHLASLHSPSESLFVYNTWAGLIPEPTADLWIGGSRPSGPLTAASAWAWTDGSHFDVAARYPGCATRMAGCFWRSSPLAAEPDNMKGNEYCLAMLGANAASPGAVRDDACAARNYYVCKRPVRLSGPPASGSTYGDTCFGGTVDIAGQILSAWTCSNAYGIDAAAAAFAYGRCPGLVVANCGGALQCTCDS